MIVNNEDIFYFVDIFCGAGGVTSGLHNSFYKDKRIARVFACINHDEKAIKSHYLNNPDTLHYTEDIRTLDISPLIEQVKDIRRQNPAAKICIWASPDCTNHSKAKGGLPRNADSRTLAEELYRYIEAVDPCYLFVENVEEFMMNGPLDKRGKPIKELKGIYYTEWVNHIKSYGYEYDYRILNSADYGAHTSRKRYFGLFAKPGMPILFPEATYSKNPSKTPELKLKKWRPVKEVLDFSDEGISVFGRKRKLVENTMRRIYAGLIKYVAGGKDNFEVIYKNGQALLRHDTLAHLKDAILPEDFAKIQQEQPQYWLDKNYTGSANHQSIDSPAGAILTKDKYSIVKTEHFITRQFNGGGQLSSIDNPVGSILTVPKINLVSTKWIMDTNYNNIGSSVNDPSPPILASRRHYYIMNPSWFGNMHSINQPCPTVVARQDKAPLYLISTDRGNVIWAIYKDDSEYIVKVKEFMVLYGIVDIKMRMLKVPELLKIQGFPGTYKLVGTTTDQKKFIGNSVTPIVPEKWIEALYGKLESLRMAA
jgi:DNA (cytosine-5)-methyltransferase 1